MKKVRHHRLDVDHRPTFIGLSPKTHLTKKDKANKRQNRKLELKKQMEELD